MEKITFNILRLVIFSTIFLFSFNAQGQAFITTWQIDNDGDQITIPTTGSGYLYDIDWGDTFSDTGVTGNITHVYGAAGTYTVTITGDFPRIFFNGFGSASRNQILSVEQWGNIAWTSMNSAFQGCSNLVINATDNPDLTAVTDMFEMFRGASSFNQDINSWDVSNVTNMSSLFNGATNFNQPLDNWNVSSVVDMISTFRGASSFNQPLNSWDVSNVTDVSAMFRGASSFNQSLNLWDVSGVIDMTSMFQDATTFNGEIGSWDVSSVTDMDFMFLDALTFNQPLNNWIVSSVTTMNSMFFDAESYNQPLNNWDVSNVTDMRSMFEDATAFNGSIGSWNVSNVTTMQELFNRATSFNQPIDNWNVSSVTTMRNMFTNAGAFNQSLNSWDVSSVTDMRSMFFSADNFNGAIGNWDVSNVTTMVGMFQDAVSFDQPISSWNVSSVTNMERMFDSTTFNQDINGWDVSNVTTLEGMFAGSLFNTSIDGWNVSNVTSLRSMFLLGNYNQPLNSWDVSSVIDMTSMFASEQGGFNQPLDNWDMSNVQFASSMFSNANEFNQDISGWDITGITNMNGMFNLTLAFDQNLGSWDVSNVLSMNGFFSNSGISAENYDNTLIGWDALPSVQSGVNFTSFNVFYCNAEAARNSLIAKGWIITDGGLMCPEGEIAVFDGANNTSPEIIDAQPEVIDFGVQLVGTGINRTFLIENQGTGPLTISSINISGSEFTLNSAITFPLTINDGDSQLLDILLTASTEGDFNETVTILSNDDDEANFTFNVAGNITLTAEPEIAVYFGSDPSAPEIFDNPINPVDLGNIAQGEVDFFQFTIENKGLADLDLSNYSLTPIGSFLPPRSPPSTIAPGTFETITIGYEALTLGNFTANFQIDNNDTNEGVFNFDLIVEVVPPPDPEIAIFTGTDINISTNEIFNGQSGIINMGVSSLGVDLLQPITIANYAAGELEIIDISFSNPAFGVDTSIPFNIEGFDDGDIPTLTFNLVLEGTTPGSYDAEVTITNNDPDESTFIFPISGQINASNTVPTITTISDITINEDEPSDDIPFTIGDIETNVNDLTITVNSSNTALVPLTGIIIGGSGTDRTVSITPEPNVSGTAIITISVDDGTDVTTESFTVTVVAINDAPLITGQEDLSTPINTAIALELDDFQVEDVDNDFPTGFTLEVLEGTNYTFTGNTVTPDQDFTGHLTVPILVNDGEDDSPVFNVAITVIEGEIGVEIGGEPLASGDDINFDDIPVGAEDSRELIITNSGTSTLEITEIIIEGDDFRLSGRLPDPIAPGNSAAISIIFQPSSVGEKTAVLTVRSTSAADFEILLRANGLSEIPELEIFNVVTTQQNGKHDFLEIRNIEFYESNRVYIYSRWGNEVYKTENYNNTDNRFIGNSDGGDELPDGTYYYVIELNGGETVENGFFLLRR